MNRTTTWISLALATCLLITLPTGEALAHGMDISVTPREGVEVRAIFESGEPMAGAQVSVFSPDDPATPWLTGSADEDGQFFFTPDPASPGTWEVQVRQAGHGDITRFEVEPTGLAVTSTTEVGLGRKAVMGLAVVWGLIGTALYFRRKGE